MPALDLDDCRNSIHVTSVITEYYVAIANQIVEAYSGKIRLTFEVAIALHSSVTLKAKTYFNGLIMLR